MKNEITQLIYSLSKEVSIEYISPETELIESGILDSFGLITLMSEVERRFNIEIPDEYFEIDNFKNINTIIKTIQAIKDNSDD